MNIQCLATEAFGGTGGIAQATRDIITAFGELPGVDHVRVTPIRGEAGAIDARVVQSKGPGKGLGYVVRALLDAMRTRPSIIYCNHLHLAPLGHILALIHRARLVIHLHGIEIWEEPVGRARLSALDHADMLLCVSRHTRRMTLEISPRASLRAFVLANTFDAVFTPGDREAARRRFGLNDEYALLTVGRLDRLEQYKGHDRVIAALPALMRTGHDIVYLVAGTGDDLPRVRQGAEDAGMAAKVRFLGYVADADLPDLYRAADLFVLPSTGEGFGIAFLEAMGCGTPAMGLDVAGASDALGDGELGACVAPEGFEQALVEQVCASAPDPDHLARAARDRFGRAVFRRRVAQLIAMLEGQGASRP